MMGRLQIDHRHKVLKERIRIYGSLDQQDPQRTLLVIEEAWAHGGLNPSSSRLDMTCSIGLPRKHFTRRIFLTAATWTATFRIMKRSANRWYRSPQRHHWATLPFTTCPFSPSPSCLTCVTAFFTGARGREPPLDVNGKLTDRLFTPQFALRWRYAFDNADISLHGVHHQDRSQPSVVIIDAAPKALFQTVTQVGGTYQHVVDAFIIKVEAA